MLTLLAGDAEVVLQPIFWLLLAVLIVGGLLTAILCVLGLFARWYWVERPSSEQSYCSEFGEERPLVEQISSPPLHEKLAKIEPADLSAEEKKDQTSLDKEIALNWLSSENVGEQTEPQVLQTKASRKRAV